MRPIVFLAIFTLGIIWSAVFNLMSDIDQNIKDAFENGDEPLKDYE